LERAIARRARQSRGGLLLDLHFVDIVCGMDWIQTVKTRGLEGALRLTLDVLEPFGALGANALWTLQPLLGVFLPSAMLGDIARALETPAHLAALRAALDEADTPPP
jgi:hypothetical protein